MQEEKTRSETAYAWQTANFTGAAFAGKLRRLSSYLKKEKTSKAPEVSREVFEEKLKEAERSAKNGS